MRGAPATSDGSRPFVLRIGAPEMQLLLCCARVHLEPQHERRVRQLLRGSIDWALVRGLALRHKMVPLLTGHLAKFPELVEPAVAQRFVADRLINTGRALRGVAELLQVMGSFQGAGIDAVPYKGPALAAQLYGNIALRPFGDLDLLIRRRDVARARELLASLGYRPLHALAHGGEEFMLQSRYGETFQHPSATLVELHWAFTNGDIALPLDYAAVEPNLVSVPVGPSEVPAFGREDLLIILCVHGAKHRWDRLEWLCGVAEAVRTAPPGLRWDHLIDYGTRLGVRRMLLLGLLLAHELLGAPVPARVLQIARADGAVRNAALQVPAFLVEQSIDAEAGSLPTDLFRFQLRERWRDRLRFLAYRLTTPSRPEQWATLRVGRHALPLHGFARPFHLLRKLGPALRWRLRTRAEP